MSLLQQKSLIPMVCPYDNGKIKDFRIKHEQEFDNGQKVVRSTVVDNGEQRGLVEGPTKTFNQFRGHCSRLGLNDEECYDTLGECFQGRIYQAYERVRNKDEWQEEANLTTNHAAAHDNFTNFFNDILDDYVKLPEGTIKRVAMAHLRNGTQKKPRDMSPMEVQQRFEDLELLLKPLRPYNEVFTGQEWKEIFFNAFPESYKAQFARVPRLITNETETLTTIQQFFTMLYDEEQKSKKPSAKAGGSDEGGKPRSSNKRQRGRNNRANKKAKNNGSNPCRREGCQGKKPHDWSQCFYNPNGSNYKPNLRDNASQGGNSTNRVSNASTNGNGTVGGRGQDNYANDGNSTIATRTAAASASGNGNQQGDNFLVDMPSNVRAGQRGDYLYNTDEEETESLFSSSTRDERRRMRQWLQRDRARRARGL